VSGHLTFDGRAPSSTSSSCSQLATVQLFDPAGASFSSYIPCSVKDGSFSMRVAPGTYRVIAYANTSYATTAPDGTFIIDKAFSVSGARSDLAFDVATVPVSGVLTFDGAPAMSSSSTCSQLATVHFLGDFVLDDGVLGDIGLGTGSSVSQYLPCSQKSGAFSTRLVPGTWKVTGYANTSYATNAPEGTFVLVKDLSVSGAQTGLALDATTVPIAGQLEFDGVPPSSSSSSCSQLATVHFTSAEGASFTQYIPCSVKDGHYALRVAPGVYRVTAYVNTSYAEDAPDGTFVLAERLSIP
jgi:hypothetical protein